jgi:hypothetical protein
MKYLERVYKLFSVGHDRLRLMTYWLDKCLWSTL